MKKILIIISLILLFACVPKGYYLPQEKDFYSIKSMKTVEGVFDCSNKATMFRDVLVKNNIKAEVVVVYIPTYDEVLHRVEKSSHALVRYQNPDTKEWHYADPTLAFHNGIPVEKSKLEPFYVFIEDDLERERK